MLSDDFWSVELGHGMGPLVLGLPRTQIIQGLRMQGLDVDLDLHDDDPELYVDEIETMLVFSSDATNVLRRLDISDERLRFGPMQVHGKPVHEIVQLLAVPSSETRWCDFFEDDEQAEGEARHSKPVADRDLLKTGTLWITSLGLGLSLYNGNVATVHLCDPDHSPQFGTGQWTAEQQRLAETRLFESPTIVAKTTNPLSKFLLVGVTAAMGFLVWQAMDLQRRWNNAPEVAAKVIALNPPPPEPFPDEYTLGYVDAEGGEHTCVFRSNDLYGMPAVGDEINIRYLPEAPDKPLTHARFRDAGFDLAVPYGVIIIGVYLTLNLLIALLPMLRDMLSRPRKEE